jgi:ABC-type long-subunit fatty acid transport system fused permease/ATPase subunit
MYWFTKHKLKIFAAILWSVVIIIFLYFKTKYNLSNIDIAKALYNFITQSFWGPFLYIFIYAIRPLVLFPATFLTFMS